MTAIAKKDVRLHKVVGTYDFAVQGGAISTIDLGVGLSKGCVVVGGFMRVLTAVLGTGASVAVQLEAADDIIAAAAISGAPWSTTGLKAIVPVFTAATMKETTVDRNISVVITAAVLTAGKFEVHLWVDQLINILS